MVKSLKSSSAIRHEKKIGNKLLIISGPTATGKTSLAISLAKKFNGELISADSRQIYRGMDIGTGKDHPKGTIIHLVDILHPNQSFSTAQYRQLALAKIQEIWDKNKLPIIVGGTGLYIKSITHPQPTFAIPPSQVLRFFLNKSPLYLLQKIYCFLDKKSYLLLNNSEKNNPHRLIRKIEINISNKTGRPPSIPQGRGMGGGFDTLHLSLTAPNQFLYDHIDQRVDQRLTQGLLGEVKTLTKQYKWSDPGLNCLAYKEFKPYPKVGALLANAHQKWRFDEHALARRQKTWFKKQPNVVFVDITQSNFQKTILNIVSSFLQVSPLPQGENQREV